MPSFESASKGSVTTKLTEAARGRGGGLRRLEDTRLQFESGTQGGVRTKDEVQLAFSSSPVCVAHILQSLLDAAAAAAT